MLAREALLWPNSFPRRPEEEGGVVSREKEVSGQATMTFSSGVHGKGKDRPKASLFS